MGFFSAISNWLFDDEPSLIDMSSVRTASDLDDPASFGYLQPEMFRHEINPATGLPMVDGTTAGVDVMGNPYGVDNAALFSHSDVSYGDSLVDHLGLNHHAFDTSYSSGAFDHSMGHPSFETHSSTFSDMNHSSFDSSNSFGGFDHSSFGHSDW